MKQYIVAPPYSGDQDLNTPEYPRMLLYNFELSLPNKFKEKYLKSFSLCTCNPLLNLTPPPAPNCRPTLATPGTRLFKTNLNLHYMKRRFKNPLLKNY